MQSGLIKTLLDEEKAELMKFDIDVITKWRELECEQTKEMEGLGVPYFGIDGEEENRAKNNNVSGGFDFYRGESIKHSIGLAERKSIEWNTSHIGSHKNTLSCYVLSQSMKNDIMFNMTHNIRTDLCP